MDPGLRFPLICLGALTVWLLVVAFWIDVDPARSLGSIKGEWMPAIVAFAIGIMIVPVLTQKQVSSRAIMLVLAGALIALALAELSVAMWYLVHKGGLPDGFAGVTDHKSYSTYVTAIGLSLILADVLTGKGKSGLIGLQRYSQISAVLILAMATYASGARNGILVMLLLVMGWAFLYVFRVSTLSQRGKWISLMIVGLVLSLATVAMIKRDDRWSRLMATVPVAWNVEQNQSWLDIHVRGLPLAEDGSPVEATAYERIAWARVALLLLEEHPLGVGFSKNSFRELVAERYGQTRAAHAHNGFLDFALSVGIPGLAVWVAFLLLVFRLGMRSFSGGATSVGSALMLLVLGFAARGCIDSTLRDHILEEFLFFTGVLLQLSVMEQTGSIREHHDR